MRHSPPTSRQWSTLCFSPHSLITQYPVWAPLHVLNLDLQGDLRPMSKSVVHHANGLCARSLWPRCRSKLRQQGSTWQHVCQYVLRGSSFDLEMTNRKTPVTPRMLQRETTAQVLDLPILMLPATPML